MVEQKFGPTLGDSKASSGAVSHQHALLAITPSSVLLGLCVYASFIAGAAFQLAVVIYKWDLSYLLVC